MGKPAPREITDAAIDCAMHQMADPKNGWRELVPPVNLGAVLTNGSGQISLQAAVALLHYGEERTGDRSRAVAIATTVADLNPDRFFLSEPWSHIYGTAIISIFAAYAAIAARLGMHTLAARFRDLLERFASTAALMEARLTASRPGASKQEKQAIGSIVLLPAGCRCWGHDEFAGGFNRLWNIMRGSAEPAQVGSRAYGTPGAYDDWGWQERCWRLALDILRAAAAPFAGKSWQELLRSGKRWAARTEMQLMGWADGSRLWAMGDDEPERDDEDENGNTPGRLLGGVLAGRSVTLPEWPNPVDGLVRLRQTNCQADLDGTPMKGWELWHSHLGEKRFPGGGFVSHLAPYTASQLVFWVLIREGDQNWVDMLGGGVPLGAAPKPPEKNITPAPPVTVAKSPSKRPRRKKWWQKLFG